MEGLNFLVCCGFGELGKELGGLLGPELSLGEVAGRGFWGLDVDFCSGDCGLKPGNSPAKVLGGRGGGGEFWGGSGDGRGVVLLFLGGLRGFNSSVEVSI